MPRNVSQEVWYQSEGCADRRGRDPCHSVEPRARELLRTAAIPGVQATNHDPLRPAALRRGARDRPSSTILTGSSCTLLKRSEPGPV